ncbi:phospholipase A and acyltransferase 3-like isoform X2 [Micropterus salmoides]|uniref:phospholipase A and acyltransferase 3-like isoform X1 n=2 Tax=Micropterus salmoides TaxID=27706 RepID=UPI0018EA7D3B|nr:phospholipase A and acyltransferase 3-like isoform X1 [Micropterus salmoides]XP_038555871.1 phospholipase A and acyltransferase 3-like isoform X2 [Micropterus salmoides]
MALTLSKHDMKPQPGDLIEIFRGPYQHWAVYIGNDFVVHLGLTTFFDVAGADTSIMMSVLTEKAMVKKEKLQDVVGDNKWKINNSLDEKYEPCPVQFIVKEACARVGKELPYSIFTGNCEHFANELRYGKKESRQARNAVAVAVSPVVVLGMVFAPRTTMVILGIITLAAVARDRFGSGKKENKRNTQ